MRLFFEDRVMTWLDSFDIFDELGRKLFRVSGTREGTRKLKVYDAFAHNKQVASLKSSENNSEAVEIKHGKRFVSTVRRALRRMKTFFDLGFLNWYAAGDFGKGSFRIFDANDRVIASVSEEFVHREEMRCIDTLPEFALHALAFTLAIDVQETEAEEEAPAPADPSQPIPHNG